MTIRERWEDIERQILAPQACLSVDSRGRERPEEPCAIRTCFQRDRDRIIHCKSFRRLKYKTQVLLLLFIILYRREGIIGGYEFSWDSASRFAKRIFKGKGARANG